MKTKIFIDGREGTTGLRINERFAGRDDVELLSIDGEKRKDLNERKRLINQSDITFLCLPDEAARESVALAEGENAVIIDTSTAHRTKEGWAYGFPELSEAHKTAIAQGKRIAVPGCYATGFISLVYPLIAEGIRHFGLQRSGEESYSGLWGCGPTERAVLGKRVRADAAAQALEGDAENHGACAHALIFPDHRRLLQRHGSFRTVVCGYAGKE